MIVSDYYVFQGKYNFDTFVNDDGSLIYKEHVYRMNLQLY